MDNAKCTTKVVYAPKGGEFDVHNRRQQSCPSIAITPKGRIYVAWFTGGWTEPHIDNFTVIHYSDDGAKTWSDILFSVLGGRDRGVQVSDMQLWMDPDGKLHVFWAQHNARPYIGPAIPWTRSMSYSIIDDWLFDDFEHSVWEMICDDPDAENPVFSEPCLLETGILRNKPLVLANGEWMYCNGMQMTERYRFSLSSDHGKTFRPMFAGKKFETTWDETMAYQMKDGTIRLFARTHLDFRAVAECDSSDNGRTWTETKLCEIPNASARFYVSRTPSDRILFVYNDCADNPRRNMTCALSDDDGKTWQYKLCIDPRNSVSYPDADFYDGKIYIVYDREHTKAKEILLAVLTEDDIINGNPVTPIVISKP